MAISPNDDFTAGQVLTATECNQFPRGVMAYAQSITSDTTITTEETQITSTAFLPVLNRYYRVTYFEPDILGGTTYVAARIKNGATTLQTGYTSQSAGIDRSLTTIWVGTFASAVSTTLTATLQSTSGTAQAIRSSTVIGFILVEDIGPA
jgi:hypothetical protein